MSAHSRISTGGSTPALLGGVAPYGASLSPGLMVLVLVLVLVVLVVLVVVLLLLVLRLWLLTARPSTLALPMARAPLETMPAEPLYGSAARRVAAGSTGNPGSPAAAERTRSHVCVSSVLAGPSARMRITCGEKRAESRM